MSQAAVQALDQLADDFAWFLRSDKRLFHAVIDGALWKPALALVVGFEFHRDNLAPFLLFEQDHLGDDPGWVARTTAARRLHSERRAQMQTVDESLGELPEPPMARDPKLVFVQQLWQQLEVRPAGTTGLTVVLAPKIVEAKAKWAESIGQFLTSRPLETMRWVVLDRQDHSLEPLLPAIDKVAMSVRCGCAENPNAAVVKGLATALAAGSQPGAGPKGVEPPPRVGCLKMPPLTPSQVCQKQIAQALLAGMIAGEQGDQVGVVRAQRQARDVAVQAGAKDQVAALELLLAGSLLAAGHLKEASAGYGRVVAAATQAGQPDRVAQGHLGQGALHLVRRDKHAALCSFAEATVHAEQADQPILTIETGRLAGQVAQELGMETQAIAFYGKAVRTGEAHPEQAPMTSAGMAALALAEICRGRNLWERAGELEATAEKLQSKEAMQARAESEAAKQAAVEKDAVRRAEAQRQASKQAAAVRRAELEAQKQAGAEQEAVRRARADAEAAKQVAAELASPASELAVDKAVPAAAERDAPAEHVAAERDAPAERVAAVSAYPEFSQVALAGEASGAPGDIAPPVAAAVIEPPASGPAEPSYESTAVMSFEEIAEIHWGGVAPPYVAPQVEPEPAALRPSPLFANLAVEPEEARVWTEAQLAALRQATNEVMDDTSTSLLSPQERAVLAGELPMEPPPLVVDAPLVPPVDPATALRLAELRQRAAEEPDDETMFGLRPDEILKHLKQQQARKHRGESE